MQMPGTLPKGDGVNPFTAGELTDQRRGSLHHSAPLARFVGGEVHGPPQRAAGNPTDTNRAIKQEEGGVAATRDRCARPHGA